MLRVFKYYRWIIIALALGALVQITGGCVYTKLDEKYKSGVSSIGVISIVPENAKLHYVGPTIFRLARGRTNLTD